VRDAARLDPGKRLVAVLGDLYPWYGRSAAMLGNVVRDVATLPALRDTLAVQREQVDRTVELLLRGRRLRGERRRRVAAALALALDFRTWEMLTSAGLDDTEAVGVATAMVTGAERC
jgi:translation initiation factor 2 gamma subunit (eIF-2gamma)